MSGVTLAGALVAGVSWGLKLDTVAQQNRDDLAALRTEETYFNIHTNRDTSGWIRGQILRDGGARDRIDLTELNIGNLATLKEITSSTGVIRSFLNGEETTLRLGVSERDLRASHFVFSEDVTAIGHQNQQRIESLRSEGN